MAGFSRMYVIGGLGGYKGVDGVNPIEMMILVGDADRQWFEPHYLDQSIAPIGRIRSIVPAGPSDANALLDACIAYYPRHVSSCPSMGEVASALCDATVLDFDLHPEGIPAAWEKLREEARPLFESMNIWRADLTPLQPRQHRGTSR